MEDIIPHKGNITVRSIIPTSIESTITIAGSIDDISVFILFSAVFLYFSAISFIALSEYPDWKPIESIEACTLFIMPESSKACGKEFPFVIREIQFLHVPPL